jgi:hypothetical protein
VTRPRTLVARRRYLGVDAVALQQSAHRVLARMVGLAGTRARVTDRQLRNDFRVDTQEGPALVARLVAAGLVQPNPGREGDFLVLPRMAEFATARVVEPLPRDKARRLVQRACLLADTFNRETSRNPVAILSIAPCGRYLGTREELSELQIGVVVCARPAERLSRWRRALSEDQGQDEIRRMIGALSSFVRVLLVDDVRKLPRPFSVAWQDPSL